MITTIVTSALMLFGASFMFLAALGVLRLPDIYIRMHAATKSGTLGVSGMILASAVHFGELGVTTRAVLIVVFLYLTAPVAAHFIGRAAYRAGAPMWDGSVVDELRGRYTAEGALDSAPETSDVARGSDAGDAPSR